MEKRLSRFIRSRRGRLSESSLDATTTPSVQGQVSSSPNQPSFFTYQTRPSIALNSTASTEPSDGSLRSFSYDSCAVGKPPTFIGKAQPGNGPVKLQASRRLSTGELIATSEEGAMKDIRGGDYIVGRKDRSASRSQRSSSNFSKQNVPSTTTYVQSPLASPRPETPTSSRTWSNAPSTPHFEHTSLLARPSEEQSIFDITPSHPRSIRTPSSLTDQPRANKELRPEFRLSDSRYSASRDSLSSQRTSTPDSSATLLALKKAEYSRLANLYGPEAAAINLVRTYSSPASPLGQTFSPLLEPVHLPNPENRQEPKRASRLSGGSDNCYEESSGTSSPQRTSYVSSQAGSSSTTAQTALTDEEPMTSREDIRSMVEQIRSTYLDAFDAHTSPPQRKKTGKKKKKQKPRLTSSPNVGHFDQDRHTGPAGRQTWHPQTPDQDAFWKPRVNSQPVGGLGRLSPIPASPPREDQNDIGIKRADSTTLGALMADMTRAHIESQKSKPATDPSKRNFSRPSTPRFHSPKPKDSWLNLEPDESEDIFVDSPHNISLVQSSTHLDSRKAVSTIHVHAVSQEPRGSFDALYQDLFGKDVDDLWHTSSLSSQRSPSLHLSYSHDNNHHNSRFSTPRKQSQIASIPESPEYTHLADPNCPNGRPI